MIPVVFICDENYAMPTTVAITSLLLNKYKTTKYDIIVVTSGLSKSAVDKLKSAAGESLSIINYPDKYSRFSSTHEYVSTAALIKFDLPNILSEYDKVIYLDSDVIVNSDLTDLYNIDIKKDYAGVVKDFYSYIQEHDNERLKCSNYFNSGVMLLNLKRLREDKMPVKLFEAKINSLYNKFMDQDVFNIVFGNNIKLLSPAYNFMLRDRKDAEKFVECFVEKLPENPVITHCTPLKPWHNKECLYFNLWYKYYKKSPYKYEKLQAFKNARIKCRQRIINTIFKFFGYRIFRIISETDKYKQLLNGSCFQVDTGNVFIPENSIRINYRNEEDLREIYEVFVQNKFGFSFDDENWTIVDISNSPVSMLYFSSKLEVSAVIACALDCETQFYMDNIKQNPCINNKVSLLDNFPKNINTGKLLYKISAGTKTADIIEKLSTEGELEKADVIIAEWQGFASGVIKNFLIKNHYKLFYRNKDKCTGIIIAVK